MAYRAVAEAARIADASPEMDLLLRTAKMFRERRKREDPEAFRADLLAEREKHVRRIERIDAELAGMAVEDATGR